MKASNIISGGIIAGIIIISIEALTASPSRNKETPAVSLSEKQHSIVLKARNLYFKEHRVAPKPEDLIPYIQKLDDISIKTNSAGEINITETLKHLPPQTIQNDHIPVLE